MLGTSDGLDDGEVEGSYMQWIQMHVEEETISFNEKIMLDSKVSITLSDLG